MSVETFASVTQEDEVFREQEDAMSAGAGSTITRLPDGKLGKLRIYKPLSEERL